MSVPPINPTPIVPQNIDPRVRYGTRAIPENFPQATSRFYLPPQRDSRFWPLEYEQDNDCLDAMASTTPSICSTKQDCRPLIDKWCTDGQARHIEYACKKKKSSDRRGRCVYSY